MHSFGRYEYVNKKTVIFNMSRGDRSYEKLLDGLSVKELAILRENPDLADDAKKISAMNKEEILIELEEEYSLEVEEYSLDDMYIGIEKLANVIPDWFISSHYGWHKDGTKEEFLDWAKDFLLQEVRINLWIKYCENQKDPKPETFHGTYL